MLFSILPHLNHRYSDCVDDMLLGVKVPGFQVLKAGLLRGQGRNTFRLPSPHRLITEAVKYRQEPDGHLGRNLKRTRILFRSWDESDIRHQGGQAQ